MKIYTTLKYQRLGGHRAWPFLFLGVLLYSSTTLGVTFQANDAVKVVRDTPLLFLDKPLRQGTTGETFQVLAYRPEQKKVFLATKDSNGKQIAVSVNEDAVTLVPPDKTKVQADVLAAVEHQQFVQAKNILDQALRASPDDVDLHSTSIALAALVRNSQQLTQILGNKKTIEADLKRQRHNADVTDHANPLDTSDHSGRQRAMQIRTDANNLEEQSSQTLRTARSNYDAALSALNVTLQQSRRSTSVSSIMQTSQELGSTRPRKSINPASTPDDVLSQKGSSLIVSEASKEGANDLPGPTYKELRIDEASTVYPKAGTSATSMTRYMFFYKQKRLIDPHYFDDQDWPKVLANEVRDWDDLSFANLRQMKTPIFTDHANHSNDNSLTIRSEVFRQAIGSTVSISPDEDITLLQEIDADGQMLGVSTVSLLEYMAAWQSLYAQNGFQRGATNAKILIDGFTSTAAQYKYSKLHDEPFRVNEFIDAEAHNVFVEETSPYHRTLVNCAVLYLKMKSSALDEVQIGEDLGNLTVKQAFAEIPIARKQDDGKRAKQLVVRLLSILQDWKATTVNNGE